MRILVIGNGLAGTMAAKTLRELEPDAEIETFGDEKYPYYPRPNLIEYLAGRLAHEGVFAFPPDWHVRQRIEVHLSSPVVRVSPGTRDVEIAGGRREKYDRLLLACGASPHVPPIPGADKPGVFTLRTLDDAQAILDRLSARPEAAVIGGGVLGLEIARALKARGSEVHVIESMERLLPRHLDSHGAGALRRHFDGAGIDIRLSETTEEILGGDEATGVRLRSGTKLNAGTIVFAVGAVPNLGLPRSSGLAVDRGLQVDDFLRTSDPHVYGAGDGIQHRGKTYGIVPASFEQARAAAFNILGQEKKYEGTVASYTLKVAGLHLTAVGLIRPEGEGFQEVRKLIPEEGIYKKIVIQEGRLVGAIWMGTRRGVNDIVRAVGSRVRVNRFTEHLLEDSFDFSTL
jgi:nitrite reductase (NADH) large subunit